MAPLLLIFTFVSTFFLYNSLSTKSEPGICIVPTADLVSSAFTPLSGLSIFEQYKKIPLSEDVIKFCFRNTQLLYNQPVTIITQKNEQTLIEAPCWYLMNGPIILKNRQFWTLSKNVIAVRDLSPEQHNTIPDDTRDTVILESPYYDAATDSLYSAGTRFVVHKRHVRHFTVQLCTPDKQGVQTCQIPRSLCVKQNRRSTKRMLFLELLQKWTRRPFYPIPYVLGGASIGKSLTTTTFKEIKQKGTISYEWPDFTDYPYQGLDCSGMIRLACNITGIPMEATNSKSIAYTLKKLPLNAQVQAGDILYWKGHIAVISNTEKGLLIEARGYNHGYGYVHEIPYHEQLKGIVTTDDLVKAYRTGVPITRIDKEGKARQTITDFTILILPTE